ncbi:MAG: hypothetical protein MUC81_11835 [Bacteroidia bacterium]|jgi:long-subunit fatty acid transport protein|nr:hypothetical protein [Bacteroidia bacterium]
MRKFIYIVVMCISSYSALAQNEFDILRYSQMYNMGTARSQAVGGAFGAVGADFSSTFINPAGLALYRRNEMHFSLGVVGNIANSNYLGGNFTDSKTRLTLPSLGLVFTKVNTGLSGDATSGIVAYNLALGYQRTNNFNQTIYMDGYNSLNSITRLFVEESNGIPSSNITAAGTESNLSNLAWRAYLTDTFDNNTNYYIPWFQGDQNGFNLQQTYRIRRTGYMGEYNVSGSLNIANKLYLGAGLVIHNLNHDYEASFEESDVDRTVSNSLGSTYRSSGLITRINTEGSGMSGRFGVIFRPFDFIRIGASAQTPSRIKLKERYNYTVNSDIEYPGFGKFSIVSPEENIDYDVVTPGRYTLSAMIMSKKFGFISIDYEMVDYSNGRIAHNIFNFSTQNARARQLLGTSNTIRAGAEIKLDNMYRIRGGYQTTSSPFRSSTSMANLTRNSYSGGFGYVDGSYFLDITGVYTQFVETYLPYQLNEGNSPKGEVKNNMMSLIVTLGYKF